MPTRTKIYMKHFEKELLPCIVNFVCTRDRSVYNIFDIIPKSIDMVGFLTRFNNLLQSIKIKVDTETDNGLRFWIDLL